MHRLFNTCIEVLLDSFYYYITNNIEKFIDQEGKKNINSIISAILIAIRIYIRPTKFLKNAALNKPKSR